jgi:hypothetical protein
MPELGEYGSVATGGDDSASLRFRPKAKLLQVRRASDEANAILAVENEAGAAVRQEDGLGRRQGLKPGSGRPATVSTKYGSRMMRG